jgi:hypothetical protein
MSTQRVPLEALQKVRQHIKTAIALPESENHPKVRTEEPPLPDSLAQLGDLFHFGGIPEDAPQMPNDRGEWFISATNPGAVFLKLPGLKLKDEFRLVTYLYRSGEEDGRSAVWAVPQEKSRTLDLQKAILTGVGKGQAPKPEHALANFMDAIEGDGSVMACAIASLVYREFQDLGAFGKSATWSHHRLINALPPQAKWRWRVEGIKDLSPKVKIFPDGKTAIEFFTCRLGTPIAIFQHVDQYPAGQYTAKSLDRPVAVAEKML